MKKGRIVNSLLLIAIALILFTPIGFHVKVFINRIISFNPSTIEEEERQLLDSYDWELQDRKGRKFNLDQFKGKIILINFWASWCPPCVAEMPSLQALYNDYSNQVEFIFVARDSEEKIDSFMAKEGFSFPIYYEYSEPPIALQSNSLPTTYIIDQSGSIILEHIGAARWNSEATRALINQLISSDTAVSTFEEEEKVNKE